MCMNNRFSQNASLPSLPSGGEPPDCSRSVHQEEEIRAEHERFERYCASMLGEIPYPGAVQQTLQMLGTMADEVIRRGHQTPLRLSGGGLAADVRRCDAVGPATMGFFYPQRLQRECAALVPAEVADGDGLAFFGVINRWNWNRPYLQCVVIGPVLLLKWLHWSKRAGGEK